MKKIILCLITLLCLSTTPVLAHQEDVGNWDGSARHEKGWSEWSLVNEVPAHSVRAKVYIPVASWGGRYEGSGEIKTCQVDNPHDNCTVKASDGSKTYYKGGWNESKKSCGSYERGNFGSEWRDGCHCVMDTSNPTNYCVKPGSVGMCGSFKSKPCDSQEAQDYKLTQPCYWFKCPRIEYRDEKHCDDSKHSSDHGCGRHSTEYYVKNSSSFADVDNKENWKTSPSQAGGYAKEIYVYSYPMEFYINFNGNGSTGTCDFAKGSNSYSDASNIKYELGNPVCESHDKVGGNMEKQAISYNNGGKLNPVKYYKHGYDFKGWSTDPNATSPSFKNGAEVTKNSFTVQPGETITLYAVWSEHIYDVNFNALCGNDLEFEYRYTSSEKERTLPKLNTNSCNESTKFIGWYEEPEYIHNIDIIPEGYHKDLNVYAKLEQERYYDHNKGSWIIK